MAWTLKMLMSPKSKFKTKNPPEALFRSEETKEINQLHNRYRIILTERGWAIAALFPRKQDPARLSALMRLSEQKLIEDLVYFIYYIRLYSVL